MLILSSTTFAQSVSDRALVIQKEMDCVDGHLQQKGGISWNDVCEVTDTPSQEHQEIVNQQLDQVEGSASPRKSSTPNLTLQPIIPEPDKTRVMEFELAPEISGITFRQPSIGLKESGAMYGINGVFTYRPAQGNALNSTLTNVYRLEGTFAYGHVNYSGGSNDTGGIIQNPGNVPIIPDKFNGIPNYLLEARVLIGKDFNLKTIELTPYFGFGYRYYFNAFYDDKPLGYNSKTQYAYIPVGFDIMTPLNKEWAMDANLEYDFLIQGNVTNFIGNVRYSDPFLGNYSVGNVTNVQNSGYGIRGSVKFIKEWQRFKIILEPYFRYWHINQSKVAGSDPFNFEGTEYYLPNIYVPQNSSTEIGAKLGLEF